MRRVAIITEYYNSKNYGGNLQAYALVKHLSNNGFDAEQLCFDTSCREKTAPKKTNKIKLILKVFNPKKLASFLIFKVKSRKKQLDFTNRYKNINRFNLQSIKHSGLVYNSKNVEKCVKNYDVFIAGSDQIWNMFWYFPAYFLDFVPASKTKFSYAASTTMQSLTEAEKKTVEKHLESYKAISVRERNAVELLQGLAKVPVEWVLDPTLLLDKDEWEKVCSPRIIKEKYIFCYFLGNDEKERNIAKKYAKRKNFKLVTIPYLNGAYRRVDEHFGDELIMDAGVEDFLSLIKHAEYVFTDSFHAVVFSGIFEKQYFVFQRKGAKYMASRIYSLCDLYETSERFCDTEEKACLEYIEGLENIDYNRPLEKLDKMKEKSINYLKENLK